MVVEVKPDAGALKHLENTREILRLALGAGEFIMLDSLPVVSAVHPDALCPGADRLVTAVRGAGDKVIHAFADLIHNSLG